MLARVQRCGVKAPAIIDSAETAEVEPSALGSKASLYLGLPPHLHEKPRYHDIEHAQIQISIFAVADIKRI